MVASAFEANGEVGEILDEAGQRIYEMAQGQTSNHAVLARTLTAGAIKNIENAYDTKALVTGLPSGFKDLDALTAGFQKSDLIILAGRPSMGKTSFALNCIQNICAAGDKVAALFTLEMSSDQLMLRVICSEAGVSGHQLRTGWFPQDKWAAITAAVGRVHEWPFYIDDSPALGVMDIRAKARRIAAEAGRLDIIFIDYLGLMAMTGKNDNLVQQIGEVTKQLKALAKEIKAPVVLICQLSRKVEERIDKRPWLSDLRDSGNIEQDADVVLFVYRTEFYKKEDTPPNEQGVAEIIIGKQRNGPLGTVKLAWAGETTTFKNLAKEETYHG